MKRLVFACSVILSLLSPAVAGRIEGGETREVKALVSQLSWDSTEVVCGGLTVLQIYLRGDAANRLVEIGKPATEELLGALEDESKVVAAHVILTAIWEPGRANYVASESIYKKRLFGKKNLGTRYSFNGLAWVIGVKGRRVDKFVLTENASTWRGKLAQMKAAAADAPNL